MPNPSLPRVGGELARLGQRTKLILTSAGDLLPQLLGSLECLDHRAASTPVAAASATPPLAAGEHRRRQAARAVLIRRRDLPQLLHHTVARECDDTTHEHGSAGPDDGAPS